MLVLLYNQQLIFNDMKLRKAGNHHFFGGNKELNRSTVGPEVEIFPLALRDTTCRQNMLVFKDATSLKNVFFTLLSVLALNIIPK